MPTGRNQAEQIETGPGFIAYFDLLGYKNLLTNNDINKAIAVVRLIQDVLQSQQERVYQTGRITGQRFCDHIVYSDSILVYTAFPENNQEQHAQIAIFHEFCAGLISELFWIGLPIRGAWAFGNYYVTKTDKGIYVAGLPIVEAYQFSNCLDVSACLIAPSAEKVLAELKILDSPSHLLGYIHCSVPMMINQKAQKQAMFLLNHYAIDLNYNPDRKISRQVLMEKFSEHNKNIAIDALSKVNNTLVFLNLCESHACQQAETE